MHLKVVYTWIVTYSLPIIKEVTNKKLPGIKKLLQKLEKLRDESDDKAAEIFS